MCAVLLQWDQVESQWKYLGRTVALPTHWERHFSEELTEWLIAECVEGSTCCRGMQEMPFASPFSLCSVLTTHFQTEQAQHLELHGPAFITSFACCSLPAIFPTLISALSLPLVLSLLPTLLPICLIFTISVQPLPPIVSSMFPLFSFELPILPSSSLIGKVSACFTSLLCVWHFPISSYTCFWLCWR